MQKRINIWLLFVMLFLLFLSVIYMLNQKSINLGVRYILEWDKLNLAIWLWVSISFFILSFLIAVFKNLKQSTLEISIV